MAADWLKKQLEIFKSNISSGSLDSILAQVLKDMFQQDRPLNRLSVIRRNIYSGLNAGELDAVQFQIIAETFQLVSRTFTSPDYKDISPYQWWVMLNGFCCLGPHFEPKVDTSGMSLTADEAADRDNAIARTFGPLKNYAEWITVLEHARTSGTATTLDREFNEESRSYEILMEQADKYHEFAWLLLREGLITIDEQYDLAVARLTPEILKYVKK